MSIEIRIGEAVLYRPRPIDGDEDNEVYVTVQRTSVPEAPQFPSDPTKRSNERRPSNGTWVDFCEAVGLRDLFYAPHSGLTTQDRGAPRLLPSHRKAIRAALKAYQVAHTGAQPGFESDDLDPTLARLCAGAV